LAVWQIASLARDLGWGPKLWEYLDVIPEAAASAEGYFNRHRSEIESLIEANDAITFEALKIKLPKLRRLDEIPA
jgi:hypothetical protein